MMTVINKLKIYNAIATLPHQQHITITTINIATAHINFWKEVIYCYNYSNYVVKGDKTYYVLNSCVLLSFHS